MTSDSISKAAEDLQSVGDEFLELEEFSPKAQEIPDSLITNRGRLYRLVAKKSTEAEKIRKTGEKISFKFPVYVDYMIVTTPGEPSEITVRASTVSGEVKLFTGQRDKNKPEWVVYWVRCLVNSIELSTNNHLFKPEVSNLKICGYQLEELKSVSNDLLTLKQLEGRLNTKASGLEEEIKKKLEALSARQETLDQKASATQTAIQESENELASHVEQEEAAKMDKQQAEVDLQTVKGELSGVKSELNLSKDAVAKLKEQSTDLDERIRGKREGLSRTNEALEALRREKSLYTDELSDYARHGDKTVATYVLLSLIPAATLIWYSIYVTGNASQLMTGEYPTFESAASAVIARIPFALVSALIIAACFVSIEALVKRVIEMHKDRLFLHKLSILANQAVQSSLKDQDLPIEEVNKHVIQTKISLINDYLMRNSVLEQVEHAPKRERAGLAESLARLAPNLGLFRSNDGGGSGK